jgi:hypothetical protein
MEHSNELWQVWSTQAPGTRAAGGWPQAFGHFSVTMTLDRYGHLMEGLDTDVAERLGALRQTARRRPGSASDAGITNGKASH